MEEIRLLIEDYYKMAGNIVTTICALICVGGIYLLSYLGVDIPINRADFSEIVRAMLSMSSVAFTFSLAGLTFFVSSNNENFAQLKKVPIDSKVACKKEYTLYRRLLVTMIVAVLLVAFDTLSWCIMLLMCIKNISPGVVIWLLINTGVMFKVFFMFIEAIMHLYWVLWKDGENE